MLKLLAIFFSFSFLNVFHASVDTMTPHQAIRDGQSTLVSSGGKFELGFFSSGGSSARYLGIWYYNIPVDQTVVWVANREAPLSVSTGVLNLTSDGNLVLYDRPGGSAVWSTTNSSSAADDPKVKLLDSGNLVLMGGNSSIVWQSFDHPTDTLLPGMKIGMDLRTNMEWSLTSWKTTSDPSPGSYSYRMDPHGYPEIYIWTNGSALPKFRTGPWNGHGLSGVPHMRSSDAILSYDFIYNQDTIYYTYQLLNNSILSRLVLNQNGVIQRLVWYDGSQGWKLYWWIPQDQCDIYGECGVHGICNAGDSPICKCLRGFDPKSPEKLILRDASDGCARRTKLNCGAGDGFLMVTGLKLPRTWNATKVSNITPDDCRDQCLRNCSCTAFTSLSEGSGCINWFGDLMDIREFTEDGHDLYVRLAASELVMPLRTPPSERRFGCPDSLSCPDAQQSESHVLVIVIVTTSLALLILSSLMYCMWRWRYRGRRQISKFLSREHQESKERGSEFSLFPFSCIVDATNNFSSENKLGEGGFGPVYKGQLPEGQEIAVKRLSARSGQGLNEFNNEILLIAKLQHRNLVRLLGFCIQGEEKLLIYEYMPNKGLDHFLFDPVRRVQLDWGRRLHIIEGIAQGLLYLHKYSRLRIIHRDLKASNVLLDDDMSPKISDFGMARIFGSEEAEANTNRIVGTYGYMPPEYAMKGHFSIKFDVFSFGVLLLEIISGKRNSSPHQYRDSLNLLGYAWKLWKEGKCLDLMDPSLGTGCHVCEISKCIHVGLMCVQESASDRPTMSDVITMLSSESSALPDPKQPAFFTVRGVLEEDSSSSLPNTCSLNNVTNSVIYGR